MDHQKKGNMKDPLKIHNGYTKKNKTKQGREEKVRRIENRNTIFFNMYMYEI